MTRKLYSMLGKGALPVCDLEAAQEAPSLREVYRLQAAVEQPSSVLEDANSEVRQRHEQQAHRLAVARTRWRSQVGFVRRTEQTTPAVRG